MLIREVATSFALASPAGSPPRYTRRSTTGICPGAHADALVEVRDFTASSRRHDAFVLASASSACTACGERGRRRALDVFIGAAWALSYCRRF